MKNPFLNIKSAPSAKLQQSQQQDIAPKRGRPPRPNIKKSLISIDKVLYQRVVQEATTRGTSNSFIITEAIKQYFDKEK